ncbi:hypothetical protein BH09BAC4_BH09BAC4_06650 [soil metagenome]
MKKGKLSETSGDLSTQALLNTEPRQTLAGELALLEREQKILLDLGNDITNVREKNDLISLFSRHLKKLFRFNHTIVTLLDSSGETYTPFLLDQASSAIKNHADYSILVDSHFSLNEPFIQAVLNADGPISFLLEDCIHGPDCPAFLRTNYEEGIREVLMTPLKSKEQIIGFLHMYADNTTSFTPEFKRIINGIAPQLSGAVANIIKNDEIRRNEWENGVLLSLSNELVSVRDRKDLLRVINYGLGKLIKFTHNVMTILDDSGETYRAYLADSETQLEEYSTYTEAISLPNPVQDGIYDVAARSDNPVVFNMKSFDLTNAPVWYTLNYTAGARELVIKTLPGEGARKHSLILFADQLNTFDENALRIIDRIASQLSTAARNIAANEEILNREQEKSFLLDFSQDIAEVRSKDDLSMAVGRALKKINPGGSYVIWQLNDDRTTLSTYLHEGRIIPAVESEPGERVEEKFLLNDGLQNRVLDSPIPLLVNVDAEIRRGVTSAYLVFWQKMGFRTMAGIPLRNGLKALGLLWMAVEEVNLPVLQGVCAQISTAMANTMANEEVLTNEREKSFLLEFSNDIAGVRTKDDLEGAIANVLRHLLHTKLAMIQLIDEDGVNLTPYMSDTTLFEIAQVKHTELVAKRIDIHEDYTARVLKKGKAIAFNIDEELANNPTNEFPKLWKTVGFTHTYAAPLRIGDKNIGTLWLIADTISEELLKGLCSQIAVAIANIKANEQILLYKQKLEDENDYLKEQIKTIYNFSEIIGSGAEMQKVYQLMSLVADSSSTVLLLGETGTGKELIARAIHNASPRKNKLMIKVNCAALPANLIESELFGHEKGAFTGAIDRRIGKFELAQNSTLFLDEIGEMPLESQGKLLRVLQERELERVGGKTTIKIDVRIVAATNRNLEEEVKAGRFRSDLYYRLNVFPINLPPLRERLEDIEPLTNFFVARFNKNIGRNIRSVSPGVLQELKHYLWPGNVRELEHLIERSVLLTREPVLREVQLPKHKTPIRETDDIASPKTLDEVERSYIIEVLKRCSGKISGSGGAAEVLNIPGTTLHSKMKKLTITKGDYYLKL